MKTQSSKRILITVFVIFVIIFSLLIVVLGLLVKNAKDVATLNSVHSKSFQAADQVRQTSDDLTQMARTYVATGNPIYEEYFYEILAIRNGKKPRPANYDGSYWHLVLAGEKTHIPVGKAISLEQRMKDLNFTEKEFRQLQKAKKISDDLTKLEGIAMNAVKGKYDDGSGHFMSEKEPDLEFARDIIHGAEYHDAIARIMKSIMAFRLLIEERARTEMLELQNTGAFYRTLGFILIGLTLLLAILCIWIFNQQTDRSTMSPNLRKSSHQSIRIKTLVYSVSIMALIGFIVSSLSLIYLYNDDFKEKKQTLTELAASQTRLIEAVARFDEDHSTMALPGGSRAATISQIVDAHKSLQGIGETGEFMIAHLENDEMVFILDQRHSDSVTTKRIPFRRSSIAQPMRLALAGQSGTLIGFDYRGEKVLATHQPIAVLNMGIVAKIDVAEIRAPFIRTAVIFFTVGLVFIIIGGMIMVWLNNPLIKRMELTEERFDLAVKGAGDGLWDYNVIIGELWYADRFRELLGYRNEEEYPNVVESWSNGLHPDDKKATLDAFEAHLARDVPYDVEYRLRTKSGEYRWFRARGRSLRDETGKAYRAAGSITDITEQKKTAEQLCKLSRATEASPASIVMTDIQGTIEYVNPKFTEVTGYSFDEAIGQNPRVLNAGHLPKEHYVKLWETILKGEEWRGEFCNRKKNGEIYWEYASISSIKNNRGEITHFVAAKENITERRKLNEELRTAKEKADNANRAKSEFLSNMSHELRTPLNGVLGYVQILQRDKTLTEKQHDSLASIQNCGQHLLTLINDVLDLSKIESGKMEVNQSPCDFHRLIKGVDDILRQRAEGKGLKFLVSVSPEVPRGIVTDATKFRQILVNLLGNAVKFTTEGSVRLEIKESPRAWLRIDIIDSGIGMKPEQLEEIFDPFKQAEGGQSAGGTGLGLAISRNLIEALGGKLTVTSQSGKGSQFTLTHPLEEVEEENLAAVDEESLKDTRSFRLAPGQEIQVLIADDRKENRDILVQLLEDSGFKTVKAMDGEEAIEKLKHHKMPLVLMDVRMPKMNGLDATRIIRKDSELKDTVVISISASVFPDQQKRIQEAGCTDFIGKPLKVAELFTKIEKHLGVKYISEETQEARNSVESPEGSFAFPAELADEISQKIKQAAEVGDVTAISEVAENLCRRNDHASPCGHEIHRLAKSFDFDGILKFAEKLKMLSKKGGFQ